MGWYGNRGAGGTDGLASAGRGVGLLASCILGWAGRVWSGLAESGFLRGLYVGYFRRCSGLVSLAVRVHRAGTRERGVGLFGEPAARLPILLPTKAYLHWRHERAAITAEVSGEAADIRLQILGLWDGASVEHNPPQRRRVLIVLQRYSTTTCDLQVVHMS
jgi:hypothetical protein